MDINSFNTMGLIRQIGYVNSAQARFLSVRKSGELAVNLYDCGNFFAEVFYYDEDDTVSRVHGIPLDSPRVDLYL